MNPNQRQSILCPNCRKLISRSENQCPYCALKRPGSFWNRFTSAIGLKHSGHLIRSVVAVNIAFFLISLLMSSSRIGMSMNPLVFLSPNNDSLILLGMTGTIPIDRFGRWWTLVSANYLHGGILHIFFNMAAFTQLASLAVREFGTYRMFIIYTVGGTAGFLVSYFAGVAFTGRSVHGPSDFSYSVSLFLASTIGDISAVVSPVHYSVHYSGIRKKSVKPSFTDSWPVYASVFKF